MVNFAIVVGVAQLVERRSVAPNVAGSIPVSHPNCLSILFFSSKSFALLSGSLLHE
jgi:hypothetical protein